MPMVSKWLAALLLAALSTACSPEPSANQDDYVGEYVFKPTDAAPGDFASFVMLKRDGAAIEVRFSKDTGNVSTTEKKWYVHASETNGQEVVIGDFGHPVERSGGAITLAINFDLGEYYEKVR